MHRVAVEVRHWMSDARSADMFAIAQLSPGPNVLIVTPIGYHVAGIAGALVATFAMCGPSAVVAYFVSDKLTRSSQSVWLTRSSQSVWLAILQAALVPVSIGLMSASGFILALTTGGTWVAVGLVVCAAGLALVTRLNPLWILVVGGILGFAGIV